MTLQGGAWTGSRSKNCAKRGSLPNSFHNDLRYTNESRRSVDVLLNVTSGSRSPSPNYLRPRLNTLPLILPPDKRELRTVAARNNSLKRRRRLMNVKDENDSWSNYTSKVDNSRKFSLTNCEEGKVIENSKILNVLILGGPEVGKTSLVKHLVRSDETFKYEEGREVKILLSFNVDDLAVSMRVDVGQDFLPFPYPHVVYDFVFIVFSISDRRSFETSGMLLTTVMLQLKRRNPHVSICLVANKSDLVRARAVSLEEGQHLAYCFEVNFLEISLELEDNLDSVLSLMTSEWRKKCGLEEREDLCSSDNRDHHQHPRHHQEDGKLQKALSFLKRIFHKKVEKSSHPDDLYVI